ncbi:uncharacterized protein FOMMEDRAFT_151019 [Fomitiporia mediterranea MF3/22]|uniref:uncharacterized protein n=1 Tax=Fomitiporia mediterranea (strain MF3/22) TaxID=694068 RepID=UPI0004407969|nr:uncharacterized protein FOMMEDRAFT_151019 [Fomitiporia mediterranea MF3/22]EJD08272.1 hypothetical protein FOMMEDRAFT_151019 [Fomitiporia mediterranea MF3/22]
MTVYASIRPIFITVLLRTGTCTPTPPLQSRLLIPPTILILYSQSPPIPLTAISNAMILPRGTKHESKTTQLALRIFFIRRPASIIASSLALSYVASYGYCSLSPVSPHPGAREASLMGVGLKPYSNHSALYLSSAQIRGGLSGSSAPSSPFDSPPLTPMVRTMNVIVPFDPTDDGGGNKGAAKREERVCPIVRFGGCLALPETVFALEPSNPLQTLGRTEPRSTFVSRDPIPAQSVARVWVQDTTGTLHSPSNPVPSPTIMQGKGLSGYGSRTLVNELSEPLVCTQTPAARASAAQTSFYSVDKISAGRGIKDADDRECFVYATRLVDVPTWRTMRREGSGLSRYTITQELMHSFNSANTKRGETFLSITYHFVPISQYGMHSSTLSTLSPLDMRIINYGHGHAHSSVSPVSSSSSSPLSASPSSMVPYSLHTRQVSRMHSYGQGTYAPHDHMYSQSQASRRVPELSVVPSLPSISQSENLMNSFNHDTYYTSPGNPASGSFSGCNIDFNGLDMVRVITGNFVESSLVVAACFGFVPLWSRSASCEVNGDRNRYRGSSRPAQ